MKKIKKIGIGLVLVAICLTSFILFSNGQTVRAATDLKKFWGSCAQSVVVGFGVNCNIADSNGKFTYATYSSATQFIAARYQASYVEPGSGSIPKITIWTTDNKPIDPTDDALLKNSSFKYSGLEADRGTSLAPDDNSQSINYLIYRPTSGSQDYALIVRVFEGGKYRVLALVNNKVVKRGSGDFIYAWKIDKQVVASTSTGAPVTNDDVTPPEEDSSCEGSNSSGFEWIFCGALSLMDKMVIAIEGQIQELLTFDTNKYLTPRSDIKVAWNVIKNLASVLLVIFMLVMIFSQAISIGPFDAYTVRKLLPKLVIAVIIMQISWAMMIYFIQLANASGEAVRDLMYAPFGGSSKMQLDDLVGQLGDGTATLSTTAIFTGAVAAIIFTGITIGGALLLAITAVLSVLVGLLVLLLRQMFIIMAVILVPLALVMWILPGTQRYWKLWSENFIKLLVLFPLIMAMIAAGRIFADVAGDTDNLLAVLIIFVGVFGPLWFLPKAFSWGGQMFSMASNAAWNGSKRMRNYPSRYAMGAAKENRAFNRQQRLARLSSDSSRHKRWDELLAGRYNIARGNNFLGGSAARKRSYQNSLLQGREDAEKGSIADLVGSRFEHLNHDSADPNEMTRVKAAKIIAGGGDVPEIGLSGKDPYLRFLMLEKLGPTWGDWDKVTDLYDTGSIPPDLRQRFEEKHIGTIHQQAAHLSPLGSKADVSRLGYQDYLSQKDEFFKEMGRQLVGGKVRETKDPAKRGTLVDVAPEERANQVIRGMGEIHGFLNDPLMQGRISIENRGDLERTLASIPIDLGNTDFRSKLTEQIAIGMSSDRNSKEYKLAQNLIGAVGGRVAEAPAGSADEANFKVLMDQLKAAAPNSPQAAQIHDSLLKSLEGRLSQMTHAAERDAVAAGHDASGVKATVDIAADHARNKIVRLSSMGNGDPLGPLGTP